MQGKVEYLCKKVSIVMVNSSTIINKRLIISHLKSLKKKRWYKLSHCEISICMYQLSLSTWIYGVHISQMTRYPRYPGFLWLCVATDPTFPCDHFEMFTIAIMTLLTVTADPVYIMLLVVLSSLLWATRRMKQGEQQITLFSQCTCDQSLS